MSFSLVVWLESEGESVALGGFQDRKAVHILHGLPSGPSTIPRRDLCSSAMQIDSAPAYSLKLRPSSEQILMTDLAGYTLVPANGDQVRLDISVTFREII